MNKRNQQPILTMEELRIIEKIDAILRVLIRESINPFLKYSKE